MHAHYEIKIQLSMSEDSLLDVTAAFLAASDLLEEMEHSRREGPIVMQALLPLERCLWCQAQAE